MKIAEVRDYVASRCGISRADMIGPGRSKRYARPRMIAMAMARDLPGTPSTTLIGKTFGGRDHTTVMHATWRINELCQENIEFCQAYAEIRQELLDTDLARPAFHRAPHRGEP